MHALPHRCTISRPSGTQTDAYGQPVATGYAVAAGDVRCRFSARRAEAPRLLVGRETVLDGARPRQRHPPGGRHGHRRRAVRASRASPRRRGACALGYRRARLLRLAELEG